MINKPLTCPCGSAKLYDDCCGLYIDNKILPETPEALMRSRYTAYTQANIDYIQRTTRGPALQNFNYQSAKNWAAEAKWRNLQVLNKKIDLQDKNHGFVEFIAYYQLHGKDLNLHELSEFIRQDKQWYYIDGKSLATSNTSKTQNKIGRNDLCPCGSGKKFKKCCGIKS